MSVTPIMARKNGDGDPLRHTLKLAITRMKQAQAAVDDKDNVAARARQFLREIDGRIEEAAVAVNTARETHAAAVAEAIAQGEKPPTATGVKASRPPRPTLRTSARRFNPR